MDINKNINNFFDFRSWIGLLIFDFLVFHKQNGLRLVKQLTKYYDTRMFHLSQYF